MEARAARVPFVGLTGGLGAGKSEALRALGELGAATLSTDAVVHELLDTDELRDALVERLGPEMAPGGRVDRSAVAERAFGAEGTDLARIKGYVADSGEGRWTVHEAIDHGVPMTALAHALFARFTSRQEDSYAMKVAAALRNQFGGHEVKSE